jgi:hypothetical protein
MTPEDIELLEQYYTLQARKDFYAYRQYIHDFKLKTGWFVREISKAIQQFYEDYKAGLRPILVLQSPPQHGKSELTTDAIQWMAGLDPDLRFIL